MMELGQLLLQVTEWVTDISISLLETAPNAGGFPFFILSPSRE
jgi:hypothetical protein